MNTKKAIILAAGKGTRMKSDLPKVLFPVLGKPIIEYVLEALAPLELAATAVVVGYRQDLVREALAWWPNLQFCEQTEQLGTGHAVRSCHDFLAASDSPVFVVAGDSPMLQTESVQKLFDLYEQRADQGAVPGVILGTAFKDNPTGLGRILRDEAGDFAGIVEEKDATEEQKRIREVNMSYYLFRSSSLLNALDALRPNNAQKEYYITDVPAIMRKYDLSVFAEPVLHAFESFGVNTLADLELVEKAMRERQP
ncbi:MAG: NTP transferase domain-containing protein [Planctomycetia bacterium]|nr:NTP transferase domain-containing protein [Planctomycetia bacterium]